MSKNIRRDDWESLEPRTFGWGINDVNYSVTRYAIVDGKYKQVWMCQYYADWKEILKRCFNEKLHQKHPTYKNCTIYEGWKYLSNFIKWVDSQPNRDWQNCSPDKDLLIVGNKQYSPDTVVYIPAALNRFILDRGNDRGELMIGVCPNHHKDKPYQAQCSNPFNKRKGGYIGVFITELEAHLAWKAKKHEYACKLAESQEDPRVAEALRSRYLQLEQKEIHL